MVNRLLILGATTETSNLVARANLLGVETFVVDPYPDAPAKKIATRAIDLDCNDIEGVCDLIEREAIEGVLPGCADVLVPAYLKVCKKAGLHCYVNDEIVGAFNNKKGLKSALRSAGLPVIGEYSYDEVVSRRFSKYPVFVKPVDNNSSKGMHVVHSAMEFGDAYDDAMQNSRSGVVLIEDVKKCDDINVGYLIENGNVSVTFTADRYVNDRQPGVGSITDGMVYPSKHSKLYFESVHQKMLNLFELLGFENGIMSIQAFVDGDDIMFYDPALRITGGQEYILSKHFYHVDILEALVRFALTGEMSNEGLTKQCDETFGGRCACNLAFSVRAGVIGRIDGIEEARSAPYVLNVTQEHFPGDRIDRIGTAQQNIARLHLVADGRQELSERIERLQSTIRAFDEDGSNMMLEGMDPHAI